MQQKEKTQSNKKKKKSKVKRTDWTKNLLHFLGNLHNPHSILCNSFDFSNGKPGWLMIGRDANLRIWENLNQNEYQFT